ncbi:MAG: rhomboid family intramembrane serine protease [Bacteroidales bacterium]
MTYSVLAITIVISLIAFKDERLVQRLLLSPYKVFKQKEWYRLVTHAFVHANFLHLIVNMFVLLSFGKATEHWLYQLKYSGYINSPVLHFYTLYLGGAIVATLTTLKKYKNDYSYQSVGASGAISGFIFFCIFFDPLENLYLIAAIPIPGIIFALAYLFYSHYMGKKGGDNVNHDAHFVGAVFGFIYPLLINPKLIFHLLNSLKII